MAGNPRPMWIDWNQDGSVTERQCTPVEEMMFWSDFGTVGPATCRCSDDVERFVFEGCTCK